MNSPVADCAWIHGQGAASEKPLSLKRKPASKVASTGARRNQVPIAEGASTAIQKPPPRLDAKPQVIVQKCIEACADPSLGLACVLIVGRDADHGDVDFVRSAPTWETHTCDESPHAQRLQVVFSNAHNLTLRMSARRMVRPADGRERLRADEELMAGRSQIGAEGAPRIESSREFANECGMRGTLRLVVRDSQTGDTEKYDFEQPYVVVGRGSSCQLRLNHPDVGFRHAYLQVFQGRLYCFDLDTETGLRFNSVPRREGWVATRDQVWIGPYSIQLSQAPGYQLAHADDEGGQALLNEPLESMRIQFANAFGRSSHSPLRPVRRSVTLLGRADRCHLKLSDQTVSRVHCALVRTDNAFWVVDLLGRDGTRINGCSTGCTPLTTVDELAVGRFRMRLCEIGGHDSVLARSAARPTDAVDGDQETISGPPREVLASVLPAPVRHDEFGAPIVAPGGISEAVLLSLMEQFSRMQQQIMAHTHEQMVVLAEMFAEMQQNQQAAVLEQLERIREISRELIQLRMQSLQPPGLPSPVRDDREAPLAVVEQERPAAAARDTLRASAPSHAEREAPARSVAASASPEPALNGSAKEPGSRRAATGKAGRQFDEQTAHAWLSQRMVELEKEHQSRWHRLMQLVGSQRSAN